MKKRFLSFVLCIFMTVSVFPSLPAAAAAEGDASAAYSQFLNLEGSVPASYDPNSTLNPYSDTANAFMLATKHELLLYTNNTSDGAHAKVLDTYIKGTDDVTDKHVIDTGSYASYRDMAPFGGSLDSMDYVCGVAGNFIGGTNGGKAQYVAYVGYNGVNCILWVQDATSGAVKATETLTFRNNSVLDHAQYFQFNSIMGITAGDYDGDGRDTIVVYTPCGGTTALAEYRFDGASLAYCNSIGIKDLHPCGESAEDAETVEDYISVALASGDSDGDNRDELAVAASINRGEAPSNKILDHGTYVTVFDLDESFEAASRVCIMEPGEFEMDDDRNITYGYKTIYAAGISAGDLNDDGVDEFVVAGYLSKPIMTETGDGNMPPDIIDAEDNVVYEDVDELVTSNGRVQIGVCIVGKRTEGYGGGHIEELSSNAATTAGLYHSGINGDDAWPKFAVQCVAVDGIEGGESVFLNGTLYDLEGGELFTDHEAYTPLYFRESDSAGNGASFSNVYIESVTVGNFDGNSKGREQVVYTVAMKTTGPTFTTYSFFVGMLGGQFESLTGGRRSGYFSSNYAANPNLYVFDGTREGALGSHLNVVPVAVDVDDDGIRGRLSRTGWLYTDPEVKAVIQAAPYFGELGGYDDFEGGTDYSMTTGYEFTEGVSDSVSFDFGYSADMEMGPVSLAIDGGYSLEWTKTYEDSVSESFTHTFTAQAYDTVALMRTMVLVYIYDIMDANGDWSEEAYVVSVPQQPSYLQLSVDDYNEFVDYYNGLIRNKVLVGDLALEDAYELSKVTDADLPANNEGNPFAYYRTASQAGEGYRSLSDPSTLGTSGGTITSEWNQSYASSVSVEESHGFHLSVSLMFGGEDAFGVSEGWMGIHIGLSYLRGTNTTRTEFSETGASGTVADIDGPAMLEAGIPRSVIEAYSFTWDFGMWTRDLGGGDVRFFGYILSNITAPPPKPENPELQSVNDTAYMLTWDTPSNVGRPYTGVSIWQVENGEYSLLTATPLAADATEYLIENLESNTEYAYVVTTCRRTSGGEYKHSLWSDEASATTPKADYRFTLTVSPAGAAEAFATFDGDTSAVSGRKYIEETMFNIYATADPGYVITAYQVIRGNNEPYNVPVAPTTNLSVRVQHLSADTEYRVITQRANGIVYYGANDSSKGSVSAVVSGVPFVSGDYALDVVTVTAAAIGSNVLTGWEITLGEDAPYTVPADGQSLAFTPLQGVNTVTAIFSAPTPEGTFTVTVDRSVRRGVITVTDENGNTLTPIGGVLTVPDGTRLTFSATANENYFFSYWGGDLLNTAGTANPYTVTVRGNMSVEAVYHAPVLRAFDYGTYNLISGAADNAVGSVAAVQNGESFPSGSTFIPNTGNFILTATPYSGYAFRSWTVNGAMSEELSHVLTVSSLNRRYSVYANFVQTPSISTDSLQCGNLAMSYSQPLQGILPDDSYVWSLASGELPEGLTLGADGVLSGIPTETGCFSFAVELGSATWGYSVQKQLGIIVGGFVPVTDIVYTGPDTVLLGETVELSAVVTPADASYRDIVWSIKDASADSVLPYSDRLTVNDADGVTVTATIKDGVSDGEDYTEDFFIEAFIPVEGITDVPTEIDYFLDVFSPSLANVYSLINVTDLGEVSPSNATHKDIRWEILRNIVLPNGAELFVDDSYSGSMTARSADGVFSAAVLRATVTDGLGEGRDYVQTFMCTLTADDATFIPVEHHYMITEPPSTMYAGSTIRLSHGIVSSYVPVPVIYTEWELADAGDTGAECVINEEGVYVLTAPYTGTVTLNATIPNGSYVNDAHHDVTGTYQIRVLDTPADAYPEVTAIACADAALTPVFAPSIHEYSGEVAATQRTSELTVTAEEGVVVTSDEGVTVTRGENGEYTLSGISLASGSADVAVIGTYQPPTPEATALDPNPEQPAPVVTTYTVHITRPVVRVLNIVGELPASMLTTQSVDLGNASVKPADATYRDIVWSVESGDATIENGELTANSAGTVTLKASIEYGAANDATYEQSFTVEAFEPTANIISQPVASPAGGIYGERQSVRLTSATDGAVIYYTLDGAVPSASSTRYTAPVAITESTVLKAIAIKNGVRSAVVEERYSITASALAVIDVTSTAGGVVVPGTPSEGGSGTVTVVSGGSQTFYITGSDGYQVKKVVVDGVDVGAVPSYRFTDVTDSHTLAAEFEPLTARHIIAVSVGAGGSISPVGSVQVAEGGSQTFTFTPDADYVLDTVTIDGIAASVSGNSYTFSNVTAAHSISVTFRSTGATPSVTNYTITAASGSHGSISPSGSVQVAEGGSQTFTFAPDANYEVKTVTVDGVARSVSGNSYQFTDVTRDHTIRVTFRRISSSPQPSVTYYTIKASSGVNGSISPSGNTRVAKGGSQTFSFLPDEGYEVDSVTVDGAEVTVTGSSYRFTNVTGKHTINVTYKLSDTPPDTTVYHTVTAVADENGSISPNGSVKVVDGNSAWFYFIPNEGYELDTVQIDGVDTEVENGAYCFENVTLDHTVRATFKKVAVYHTVTVTAGENGSANPSGDIQVIDGGAQTIAFTADEGYEIDAVYVNGEAQEASGGELTVSDVTDDMEISVTFKLIGSKSVDGKTDCRCLWARIFGFCAICGIFGHCIAPWCVIAVLILVAAAVVLIFVLRKKRGDTEDSELMDEIEP